MRVGDLVCRRDRTSEMLGVVLHTEVRPEEQLGHEYAKVFWTNGRVSTWRGFLLEVVCEAG